MKSGMLLRKGGSLWEPGCSIGERDIRKEIFYEKCRLFDACERFVPGDEREFF